ncbi:hypothetical protein BH20VER1_BH20VER1_24020 [soil metagenome]
MRLLKVRPLLVLLTLACLPCATTWASEDGKIEFPANSPTFTVEIPADWSHKPDKDGNLDCEPGDDSGYMLSIVIMDEVRSQKELKAALPELAKEMAKAAKLKNFEIGDIETDENGNGVSFSGIRGDGKTEGIDFVVTVHGFEPRKGRFYALVSAGSKGADAKHEKAYDSITASIEPIEE